MWHPSVEVPHPEFAAVRTRWPSVDRLPASPACPRVDLPLFEDDVDMEVAYDALKQEALRGTPESEVARIQSSIIDARAADRSL